MRIFVISVATVAAFCTPIALIVWTYTQSTASALYLIFVPPTLFALALWRIIKMGSSVEKSQIGLRLGSNMALLGFGFLLSISLIFSYIIATAP